MRATPDTLAALARSSPWRWTTLHLRHRDPHREVEAWVRRPGELLVRRSGRPDERVVEPVSQPRWSGPPGFVPPRHVAPQAVVPLLRADGLVHERPAPVTSELSLEYGDPMYENYQWTALLDPVELSAHVRLDDVREEERAGRRTWWARAWPQEGYDPTCGCCPLLWSEVSDRVEGWEQPAGTTYPSSHDIALDVETGIVVSLRPRGGSHPDDRFEVDVLAVDDAVDLPPRAR